jgi:hypothetical protein
VSGFTPGPWSFAPASVIIGADGKRVCQVFVRLDDTDLGDGFLIASAPDLLALAYQYRNDLMYPPSEDSKSRRLAAIDAVIGKAEGISK